MKRIAALQLVFSILAVAALVALLVAGLQAAAGTDPVVAAAYARLSDADCATIVDWRRADVSEHDYSVEQPHSVYDLATGKTVDLAGRKVHLVVFRVKDPGILGDIRVYVDTKTMEVLGVDLRD